MAKHARRESEFFKELKKQDLCEDEDQKQNEEEQPEDRGQELPEDRGQELPENRGHCDEHREDRGQELPEYRGPCDELVMTQSHSADIVQLTSQYLTDDETHTTTAADGGDDDDVTGFTSLQPCESSDNVLLLLLFISFPPAHSLWA